MLNTQIPLVRDLLDIGYAFPPESEQRQRCNDAAESLSACVESLKAAQRSLMHYAIETRYCHDACVRCKIDAALAGATRDWSHVL